MTQKFIHGLARLGIVALLGLSACGSEPQATAGREPAGQAPPGGDAPVEDGAGSIELSLKIGDKQLDSMNYAIVGSGFVTSGSFDVTHSTKVSGIIAGIPFGSDYALTMTGKALGATPLDCSGSASFDLNDVGPLPVTLPITCRETSVVEPTPAPVPPFAVVALGCMLAALGVAAQRRSARA